MAEQLRALGCCTVKSVQNVSQAFLQAELALSAAQAATLSEYAFGRDARVVTKRPPPRTISLQMTLTPVPLKMHPSHASRGAACGGSEAGWLLPLLIHAADALPRMCSLCSVMVNNLLARVIADRCVCCTHTYLASWADP